MQLEEVNFNQQEKFTEYCKNVGQQFCPYLIKAEMEKVLFRVNIDLNSVSTITKCQELILYNALLYTEYLRSFRTLNRNFKGLYFCVNLCFETPPLLLTSDASKVLDWPHWILKCLYSKVGIMFGKFWINETLTGKNGFEVPSPPINFLSIRSAIKPRDPYFLSNTNFILEEMLSSNDTGENLHLEFGISNFDQLSIYDLTSIDYYATLKLWANEKLENLKNEAKT